MADITDLIRTCEKGPLGHAGGKTAASIAEAAGLIGYENSLSAASGALGMMAKTGVDKSLLVVFPSGSAPGWTWDFGGRVLNASVAGEDVTIRICALTHENARALRRHFPHTAPACFGTETAAGTGDRLGIATPGHVRAVRGSGLAPFFAQQSIREMTRTHRQARQVIDDASTLLDLLDLLIGQAQEPQLVCGRGQRRPDRLSQRGRAVRRQSPDGLDGLEELGLGRNELGAVQLHHVIAGSHRDARVIHKQSVDPPRNVGRDGLDPRLVVVDLAHHPHLGGDEAAGHGVGLNPQELDGLLGHL